MQLSLEIVKQRLEKDYNVRAYGESHTGLVLDRPKYYYPGIDIRENGFYIIDNTALCLENWAGRYVICAGRPDRIPENVNFHLLIAEDANTGQVINSVNDTFDFYDKWELALKSQPRTDQGHIIAMLDASIPVFGNVIRLMNTNFKFEYVSDEGIERGLDIQQPDESGFVPLDIVNALRSDPYYIETNEIKTPFIFPVGILPFRSLCSNLFADEKLIGRIIINEVTRPFHDTDLTLLSYFTEHIENAYFDFLQTLDEPIIEIKGVINRVLSGGDPGAIDLMKTLDKYQWKRNDCFICLKLSTNELTSPERHYVSREFEKRYTGTCGIEFDSNVVVVADLSLSGWTLETLIRDIESFATEGRYKVGASAVFNDIFDLKWHYIQASTALKTGMAEESVQWFFSFETLRMKYLMNKCAEELSPAFICNTELIRLKRIDAETGTWYFKSLSLYLKNCRNAVQTAEALFIHRLTLIYRLNRIKEITALKWDTQEDYFELLLSVNILENAKA